MHFLSKLVFPSGIGHGEYFQGNVKSGRQTYPRYKVPPRGIVITDGREDGLIKTEAASSKLNSLEIWGRRIPAL